MSNKNFTTRIAGFGLEARLNNDNSVTMTDSRNNNKIVTIKNPGPRVLAQFKKSTNYRAGQHSDSKMAAILECMMNVPELEEYM